MRVCSWGMDHLSSNDKHPDIKPAGILKQLAFLNKSLGMPTIYLMPMEMTGTAPNNMHCRPSGLACVLTHHDMMHLQNA